MDIKPGLIEKSGENTYIYKELIGSGVYGAVWKATKNNTETVAIKVKIGDHGLEKNEILANKRVSDYKDICNEFSSCLLDTYYDNNRNIRIVIDYIDGITLNNLMSQVPLTKRSEYTSMICKLIKGMDVIHSLNMTMPDIHGDNIMIETKTKRPVYIDWGHAVFREYYEENDSVSFVKLYGIELDYMVFSLMEFYDTFDKLCSNSMKILGFVIYDWMMVPPNVNRVEFYDKNPHKNLMLQETIDNYKNILKEISNVKIRKLA